MKLLKKIIPVISILLIILVIGYKISNKKTNENKKLKEISGEIIDVNKDTFVFKDQENNTYTFNYKSGNKDIKEGVTILIEYLGVLDKKDINNIESYSVLEEIEKIPAEWDDSGIFSDYYQLAYEYLNTLSLDEKIGQLLLVRVPEQNKIEALEKYNFGGYILFKRDIQDKTKSDIINMIKDFQKAAKTPLLIATDEEGGTVVRVSSNKNIRQTPFLSPQNLYKQGGFDLIQKDTIEKSKLLKELGINVNLAPVADVSTNSNDYIYNRSFGQNTALTSQYIEKVISASKEESVSYTLKHFPGYGNNKDTHTSTSTQTKSYEDIVKEDLPPFEAGINVGAEAVLVSHNIVTSIEQDVPASLSPKINQLLRKTLNFTGIVMTDDLDMQAVKNHSTISSVVDAIKAGNDLLIVTDYEMSINDIKEALNNGNLTESEIERAAFKVIAWKYYKLLFAPQEK